MTDRLDALVNNAGVMIPTRQTTSEGIELNFAVHHLAPYSMTSKLLPLLARLLPLRPVSKMTSGFHS